MQISLSLSLSLSLCPCLSLSLSEWFNIWMKHSNQNNYTYTNEAQ